MVKWLSSQVVHQSTAPRRIATITQLYTTNIGMNDQALIGIQISRQEWVSISLLIQYWALNKVTLTLTKTNGTVVKSSVSDDGTGKSSTSKKKVLCKYDNCEFIYRFTIVGKDTLPSSTSAMPESSFCSLRYHN